MTELENRRILHKLGQNQLGTPVGEGSLFSLILRTQGNRDRMLAAALESLAKQSEADFEVLLVVHDKSADGGGFESAKATLAKASLSDRVRTLRVAEGGRCRPLNVGIESARGAFVCFLDDDDILLPNHFAAVRGAITSQPADAYHTYGSRCWTTADGKVLRTTDDYIDDFNVSRQLVDNRIPICNMFVRRSLLNEFEVRFDETIEVLEDWKFLMDVNQCTVVVPVRELTTLISIRDDGTNTTTGAQYKEAWMEGHRLMEEYLASKPRLLTSSELESLASYEKNMEALRQFREENESALSALSPLVRFAKWIKRTGRAASRIQSS